MQTAFNNVYETAQREAPILGSDRPPRILGAALSAKLRCAIYAIDILRDVGCRVQRQDLHPGENKAPTLYLEQSSPQLRGVALAVISRPLDDGGRECNGRLKGCEILWTEHPPQLHQSAATSVSEGA